MNRHMNTHTNAYRHLRTEAIIRNQLSAAVQPAHACFKNNETDGQKVCNTQGKAEYFITYSRKQKD